MTTRNDPKADARANAKATERATEHATERAMALLGDNTAAATIRGELKALLDAVPGARRVLPHLTVVERLLAASGFAGLDAMPTDALEKAADQLGKLPIKSEGSLLPQMHMLLNLAVGARDHAKPAIESDQFISSFLTEEKLEVNEISHTDFDRLMDEPPPGRAR